MDEPADFVIGPDMADAAAGVLRTHQRDGIGLDDGYGYAPQALGGSGAGS
jgi:hypothetical protein